MNRVLINLLCAVAMLFSVPCLSAADSKVLKKVKNGGFEQVKQNIPKYWTISGQKDALSFDEDVTHGGAQSARIYFREPSVEGISLSMAIDVEATKRYDFAGYLKTENLEQGYAQIYTQFFDRDKNKLEKSVFPKISGTTEWHDFHLWVVAPTGADSAHVTCFANGKGKAWFDDIRFTSKLQGGY